MADEPRAAAHGVVAVFVGACMVITGLVRLLS
jgi:hypothetical protein